MTKTSLESIPLLADIDKLERLAKSASQGYPPYNVAQTSDNSFRITLSVAGFTEEDLSITVEDNLLVIRGRPVKDSEEFRFLHRGIAVRQFHRSFVLADGVVVGEAAVEDGLLHVDLRRFHPVDEEIGTNTDVALSGKAAETETDIDSLSLQQADAAIQDEASPDIVHIREVPVTNVKKMRERLGMTQKAFAETYGFSLGAVRHWEQNARVPGRGERILLSMISADPEKVAQIVRETF